MQTCHSFAQLYWLPIEQRVTFKIAVITLKALHGSAPDYITELIKPYTPKCPCSSAISTLEDIENKRRTLQTLSIDNVWSNKNFLYHLTFRMLQQTSSEVNGQ